MTLLELLVKELPKRGGWPDGADGVVQDRDDIEFYFFTGHAPKYDGASWWFAGDSSNCSWIYHDYENEFAEDNATAIVTRDQYEAALAASQQPVWSGEGLPPVGTVCDFQSGLEDDFCYRWGEVTCTVVAHHDFKNGLPTEAILAINNERGLVTTTSGDKCRPIPTEAERKREETIQRLSYSLRANGSVSDEQLNRVYDDIAAGKIPGVELSK